MAVAGLVVVLACVGVVLAFAGSDSDRVSPRNNETRTFTIQSQSMSPTLRVGEKVQINTSAPCCQRGDIVVFRTGPNALWHRTGTPYLAKRVVALPGDTISSCVSTRVCVNGKASLEQYLAKGTITTFPSSLPYVTDVEAKKVLACESSSPPGTCTVPKGTLFVLGDARMNSLDSRALGPISAASIVGPAVKVR
jgi:signal peptidase I